MTIGIVLSTIFFRSEAGDGSKDYRIKDNELLGALEWPDELNERYWQHAVEKFLN